jgi:16S rRNA C967 or C1407 C5-methylase (RsmB/RsmF family)
MSNPSLSPVKEKVFLKHFEAVWNQIFTTPVHVDAALSKLPDDIKPWVAEALPQILRRPHSVGKVTGVRVNSKDPWVLRAKKGALANWEIRTELARGWLGERLRFPTLAAFGDAQMEEFSFHDFPHEVIAELQEQLSSSEAKVVLLELASDPPQTLRLGKKVDRSEFCSQLEARGCAKPTLLSPFGVSFDSHTRVFDLREQGGIPFEIQDEGSQWMALFALDPDRFAGPLRLAPGPLGSQEAIQIPSFNSKINFVDACAGAGGKSLAIAELLGGKGRVYAYDVSETKLRALRRRAESWGFRNIQTRVLGPASEPDSFEALSGFDQQADIVLVDAPCSGWGVLRRNPDIKWRERPQDLGKLPPLQLKLLTGYSRLVRPGGRLIYGVCTFRLDETLKTGQRFLLGSPDFASDLGGFLGPGPCDGFYMQSFVRQS